MSFDYSRLRGRIIEKCGSQEAFAKAMRLSPMSISKKLNNKVFFSQDEINTAVSVLGIKPNEISIYFFQEKVQ